MTVDDPLTPAQRDDLRAIAGMIIPASVEFDVPGADDPAIQADILATLGRDAGHVREALDLVARLARRHVLLPDMRAVTAGLAYQVGTVVEQEGNVA